MRISDWSSDVCSSDLRSFGTPRPHERTTASGRSPGSRINMLAPPSRMESSGTEGSTRRLQLRGQPRFMDYQSTSGFPFHPIPGTCRDAPHRKTDSEGQAGSSALEWMTTALGPIRMQSALKKLRRSEEPTSELQ